MADNPFSGAFDSLTVGPAGGSPPSPVPLSGSGTNTNPFAGSFDNLDKTDKIGAPALQVPQTQFSKVQDLTKESDAAKAASDKTNSFWSTVGETLKGLLPGSSGHGLESTAQYALEQPLQNNPKELANQAALGLANGITLGGTDYLQRKAFEAAATKNGMTPEDAAAAAATLLKPSDPGLSAVRGGFDIAGSAVPYMATDGALAAGLKYAAPNFVANYGRAAKLLTDVGAFNLAGQTAETFLPADEQNRGQRALLDTATAGLFNLGSAAWRAVRPTIFKSPVAMSPVSTADPLVPHTTVQSADSLAAGADAQIKQLEEKGTLASGEKATLDFLKANRDNPDELFKYNQAPNAQNVPVPNAITALTVKPENGAPIHVATNDMGSLTDFIKGSGDINYKTVDNLGKDIEGNPIQARHEFNSTTGQHTIYTTDATTAGSLAHELGHYFDTSLTKDTSGLAKILPDYAANRQQIEDTLGSVAVKNLGGNATSAEVSAEIKRISDSLQAEMKSLSEARGGAAGAAPKASEQFADAVSQALTVPGKAAESPTLMSILKDMEQFKKLDTFGTQTSTVIKDAAENQKVPMLTAKEPSQYNSGQGIFKDPTAKESVYTTKEPVTPKGGAASASFNLAPEANVLQFKDIPAEIRGDAAKTLEYAKSNKFDAVETGAGGRGGKKIQVINADMVKPVVAREKAPLELPRTPTGHQPATEAFKAEKITTDQGLETFMNTKILSKLTGEERIGKTNEDIVTRSFASKMDEKSFDKILTQRFGNMSEDIVAAKRMMADKATMLADTLKGRDISQLTGTELRDVMTQYQQTIDMFENFSGMRTELSNAFRSLGIAVNKGENDALRGALETIQTSIGDTKDPFQILGRSMKALSHTADEYYFAVWYPALLSGFKTWARNIVGNASGAITAVTDNLFSQGGRQEIGARIMEMIQSHKDSMNMAARVMKGENFFEGKFVEAPVPEENLFSGKFAFVNKTEYVGRFLNAQDAYFSNTFKRAEVAASRVGNFSYGLENKEAITAVNDAVGTAMAQRMTFRNQFEKTVVGDVAKALTSLKGPNSTMATRVLVKMFVPFVRTIANITDRQLDYLPIVNLGRTFMSSGLYEQRASRILAEADIGSILQKEAIDGGMTLGQAKQYAEGEVSRVQSIVIDRLRNQQMGKFYFGLALTTAAIPLAATGVITGSGPSGKNANAVLQESGWRPNSIMIGGVAYPYSNSLLPFSAVLSMVGNIGDAVRYGKGTDSVQTEFTNGMVGFMRSEFNASFLSGMSSIISLINGDTTGDKFLQKLAADALPIPAMWTQIKDTVAPGRYSPNGFGESALVKLGFTTNPITGQPIQPNLDAFGQQKQADFIYGLSPDFVNAKPNDPVIKFMNDHNAFVGKPQPTTKITSADGTKRQISPAEYTKYVQKSGQALYNELKDKVRGGYFNGMTDAEIRKEVTAIAKQSRSTIKDQITF